MSDIWKDDERWKAVRKGDQLKAARERGDRARARQWFEREGNLPEGTDYINENSCPKPKTPQGGFAAAEANDLVVAFLVGYEYGTFLNKQHDISRTSNATGFWAANWARERGADLPTSLALGAFVAAHAASTKIVYHSASYGLGGWLLGKLF
jgi:hypothetical protein